MIGKGERVKKRQRGIGKGEIGIGVIRGGLGTGLRERLEAGVDAMSRTVGDRGSKCRRSGVGFELPFRTMVFSVG